MTINPLIILLIGRQWKGINTQRVKSQERLRNDVTKRNWKAEKKSSLEPSEGAWPYQQLDSRLWASGRVRECIDAVLSS